MREKIITLLVRVLLITSAVIVAALVLSCGAQ